MISGNEQATEQFYVQRIGADDFMKKPFSRAELFTRIQKLLDKDLIPIRFNEYIHNTENDDELITEDSNTSEKPN